MVDHDMRNFNCVCDCVSYLTRSWLVELESSSGNGLETPRATQFAKMANRMKMSNGLSYIQETTKNKLCFWHEESILTTP